MAAGKAPTSLAVPDVRGLGCGPWQDSLEPVEKKMLVNRVRKGKVILLDVRPAGRIPCRAYLGGRFGAAE